MKSPSKTPPVYSSTKLMTRQNPSKEASGSAPLSKRFDASVLTAKALDPFLTVTGLKYALSIKMFFVLSSTALS